MYGHRYNKNNDNQNLLDNQKFFESIDWTQTSPLTALYSAITMGHVDIAQYLLENGARVDLPTNYNPLNFACSTGQVEMVKVLLRFGADIQSFDSSLASISHIGSTTPLGIAILRQKVLVVKELLSQNANIEIGSVKFSPLILSALIGNKEICQILLNKRAIIDNYEISKVQQEILSEQNDSNADGIQGMNEVLNIIEGEKRHRVRRTHFDSFINRHIESKKFVKLIYSTCYPSGDSLVATPEIGWSRADKVLNKYFFDETFYFVHLFVAQVLRKSENKESCSIKEFLSRRNNKCSTLMTVLTSHLSSYLQPLPMNLCPQCSKNGILRCSRCKQVFFCSSTCQKKGILTIYILSFKTHFYTYQIGQVISLFVIFEHEQSWDPLSQKRFLEISAFQLNSFIYFFILN